MLDKAEAEVRRAQAHRRRWNAELAAAKRAKAEGRLGDLAVTRAESEYDEAEAALQAALADRDLSKLNLEATLVTSPIEGVVKKVVVGQGETVTANVAAVTIVSLDPLHIDFYMDEATARFLDRAMGGGKINRGVNLDLPIEFAVGYEAGYTHRGRLKFLDHEVQPVAENAILGRAAVPNDDWSLAPGMRARIRVAANGATRPC